MKLFWLTCIFLFACYSSEGQAYMGELIRLEKAIYKSANKDEKDSLLLLKSQVYKANQVYDKALETLERTSVPKQENLRKSFGYEKVVLNYFLEDYAKAYHQILLYELQNKGITKELLIFKFLVICSQNSLQEARDLLVTQKEDFGFDEETIDEIMGSDKIKSPRKAHNISLFFPGFGQMYAGYFWRGMLSGGIQTGLVLFSAYSFVENYFFTGTLSGVALFYTFYFGGARYAEQLAVEKNLQITSDIKRRFLKKMSF